MRLALLALVAAAGCTGLNRRLWTQSAVLSSQPTEVQSAVRRGDVLVGFTQELVLLALGEPQRRFYRLTASDDLQVWSWVPGTPFFAMPLNTISMGDSPTGIRDDESARVVFRFGRVVAVEKRR